MLIALNHAANWCLRKVGVTPADEVADGQAPDALRHLVEHSATVGTLDERYHANLTSALELEALTIGDIASRDSRPASVRADADPTQIQDAARTSGHLRLLICDDDNTIVGVVHVRDSLTAAPSTTARSLMRPVLTLTSDTPVYEALRAMRETRNHLTLIAEDEPRLITMADVLNRLLTTAAPHPAS